MSIPRYVPVCLVFFVLVSPSLGFQSVALPTRCGGGEVRVSSSTREVMAPLCMAAPKKKRRRRKQQISNDEGGDLPDFELKEEMEEANPSPRKPKRSATDDPLGEITPSMMASSAMGPTRSVNDLLRDRSIEQKLNFDDEEDAAVMPPGGEPLPDLLALARQREQQTVPLGKKKARQAARIAAAEAAAAQEEGESILTKIPFILDEKGNVSGVKILESGAWFGIGLLVVWEFYINSPFFERAQPMIPVVYDLFL